MKVLIWLDIYWPHIGGREILVGRLLPALAARGHRFTVVTSHHDACLPDREVRDGVEIRRLPFFRALGERDVAAIAGLQRRVDDLLGELSPDLVHLHDVGASALFCLRSRALGATQVLTTMHYCPPPVGPGLLAQGLAASRWVTAVSSAALAACVAIAPSIGPRSSVIRNGLEPPAQPDGQPIVPRPADAVQPPRLLCVGKLTEGKGFDLAIDALAAMGPARGDARLIVAGDGPARPALRRQAESAGLGDAVEFAGWVPPAEVWALMENATMVLAPSRETTQWQEGLPLVALEAALMARPMIASRTGGLPEIILDGKTGLLVEPGDAAGLADAIARLLADPAVAAAMGRSARERALREFRWQDVIAAYDALYRRLVPGG